MAVLLLAFGLSGKTVKCFGWCVVILAFCRAQAAVTATYLYRIKYLFRVNDSPIRLMYPVFALVCICCSSALADEPIKIKVVTDIWLNSTNKDGSGYYFDLLRDIYTPHGIELSIEFTPYSRALAKLKYGQVDVLLGAYKGQFKDDWYSQYPVENDVVDGLINSQLNEKWQGLKTLKGKKVVAEFGYAFGDFIGIDADYTEMRDVDAMIKMLASGRVDAILDYKINLLPKIQAMGLADRLIIKHGVFEMPVYFVFYKPPQANNFKQIFDVGMKTMVEEGRLKPLLIKHLGGQEYYPDFDDLENDKY